MVKCLIRLAVAQRPALYPKVNDASAIVSPVKVWSEAPRSTGCWRLSHSVCRLDLEVPQLRRYLPGHDWLPGLESRLSQFSRDLPSQLVGEVPQHSVGISPVNRRGDNSHQGRSVKMSRLERFVAQLVLFRPVSPRSTWLPAKDSPLSRAGEVPQFRTGAISPVNWLWLRGSAFADWRGSPVPSVSPRSTGCRRGTACSGWRGCPVPSVSPHSTGCHTRDQPFQVGQVPQLRRYLPGQLVLTGGTASVQVGEVAQFRRYLPGQLVAGEGQPNVRLERLPSSVGISPVNWLAKRSASCPGWRGCPVPSLYLPGQLVVIEGQLVSAWRGSPTP